MDRRRRPMPRLTVTFHKVGGMTPLAWWEAVRPGRGIVRENRAALGAAEATGNHHHFSWTTGEPTPVAPTFDRLARLWDATPDGESFTIEWPSLDVTAA